MAQVCSACAYYTAQADSTSCPRCGQRLQFTMLGPPSMHAEEEERHEQPAWVRPPDHCVEVLELPLSVRLGQIASGIGAFFVMRRFGSLFLMVCFGDLLFHESPVVVITASIVISLVIYGTAAILAGVIAGAWSVNWVPQGIGVGLGLFAIPLFLLALFIPQSLILYLMIVLVTTPLTVFGRISVTYSYGPAASSIPEQ